VAGSGLEQIIPVERRAERVLERWHERASLALSVDAVFDEASRAA
jgi:hypothetical protein